jgi:hypothetical protein
MKGLILGIIIVFIFIGLIIVRLIVGVDDDK